MTRLFTDGAEFGDTLFWDINYGSTTTASSTSARTGTYSYRNGTNDTAEYAAKYISESSELYVRFGVFNSSIFGVCANYFISFLHDTTRLVGLRLSATQTLSAHVSASEVDTGSTVFSYSTWHLIQMYVKIGNNPDGRIIVYLDGILEIDYTGDTQPGADTTINAVGFAKCNTTGQYSYIDDIACNDTNGVTDNSWCGDGCIEILMANANGDTNDWTGSDGDSVNNYLLVDEKPHDTDTTYVKATTAVKDLYNVADYTDTNKIVTRIWSECRARDAAVAGGAIKIGYKHGGVEYLSGYQTLPGIYSRVVSSEAALDPSDSTIWSNADLDAIQFIVENSSSSSSTSSSSSSSSTTSSSSVIP